MLCIECISTSMYKFIIGTLRELYNFTSNLVAWQLSGVNEVRNGYISLILVWGIPFNIIYFLTIKSASFCPVLFVYQISLFMSSSFWSSREASERATAPSPPSSPSSRCQQPSSSRLSVHRARRRPTLTELVNETVFFIKYAKVYVL